MRAKDAGARYGARVAARLLAGAGMAGPETTRGCRSGEVDIVARDGDCLVLCEVKTRRSGRAGSALEAVTPRKVRRLRGLAAEWLQAHPGVSPPRVRLDVVAVTVAERGAARVEHVRGVG